MFGGLSESVVFLSPHSQFKENSLKLRHSPFLAHPFQFHIHCTTAYHVTPYNLSNWKRRQTNPRWTQVTKFCLALNSRLNVASPITWAQLGTPRFCCRSD